MSKEKTVKEMLNIFFYLIHAFQSGPSVDTQSMFFQLPPPPLTQHNLDVPAIISFSYDTWLFHHEGSPGML